MGIMHLVPSHVVIPISPKGGLCIDQRINATIACVLLSWRTCKAGNGNGAGNVFLRFYLPLAFSSNLGQVHCVLGNVGGIPPERFSWVPYPFSCSWAVPPTIAVRRSPPNVHFLVPLFFFVQLFVALIINILNLLASSLLISPPLLYSLACPPS
jgi:hypothetical protein